MMLDNQIIVALVYWIDASFSEDIEDAFLGGLKSISCGVLVDMNDHTITLSLDVFENGQISDVLVIPKPSIVRMSVWEAGKFREVIDEGKEVTLQGITHWPEQSVEEAKAQTDESGGLES